MHLRPLPIHTKVELILITLRRLLCEPLEPVLLRVVVPCAENIVFMLLENTEPLPMCKLRAFFVVSSV